MSGRCDLCVPPHRARQMGPSCACRQGACRMCRVGPPTQTAHLLGIQPSCPHAHQWACLPSGPLYLQVLILPHRNPLQAKALTLQAPPYHGPHPTLPATSPFTLTPTPPYSFPDCLPGIVPKNGFMVLGSQVHPCLHLVAKGHQEKCLFSAVPCVPTSPGSIFCH